jgi:hypothetical protein
MTHCRQLKSQFWLLIIILGYSMVENIWWDWMPSSDDCMPLSWSGSSWNQQLIPDKVSSAYRLNACDFSEWLKKLWLQWNKLMHWTPRISVQIICFFYYVACLEIQCWRNLLSPIPVKWLLVCAAHTFTFLDALFISELQASGSVTLWLIASRTNLWVS